MIFHPTAYSNRNSLFDALDAALLRAECSEGDAWRLRSLRRCLGALESRSALSDRGALLRQAAWLLDNRVALPKAGWDLSLDSLSTPLLDRFGITLVSTPERWDARLLSEGTDRPEWPVGLRDSIGLDPRPRRWAESASPDGALLRLTPHRAYRMPAQKAAARALLTMPPGASLIVSMPTGAGKSLLFQLGASWWREEHPEHPSCVVVIVPTVGLALDHAQSLQAFPGLEGSRALTGDIAPDERQRILTAFLRGEIPILLMNPETAFHSARETLQRVCAPRSERLGDARAELAAVFIDEAHIIESWGRSFRPDFQRLGSLVRELQHQQTALRTVLLSATLGDDALEMLRNDYGQAREILHIQAPVPRYELDLFARKYDETARRDRVLSEILDVLPRPAVVYITTRDSADRVAKQLLNRGYGALAQFTGDTEAGERKRILAAWRDDELDIVVATSAFGMGIDKADVRAVVHACLPEDAARYYQEVGRAGRDGHRAVGVCLWTPGDLTTARASRRAEWLRVDTSVARWKALVEHAFHAGHIPIDPTTGQRVMEVHLAISPERDAQRTGQHTRRWNRTLLNLMQRARAIEVLRVDEEREIWTVAILQDRVLECDESFLESVFSIRDEERRRTDAAFEEFHAVIDGGTCLLADTYELIESGNPLLPECGRCGPCLQRHHGAAPPAHVAKHNGAQWAAPRWQTPAHVMHHPSLSGVVLLEHQELDDDALLAERLPQLMRLGIVQFIMPHDQCAHAARLLRTARHHPGLVLGFEERVAFGWALYDQPTALFVSLGLRDVFEQALVRERLSRRGTNRSPLIIIAREGSMLDGRALTQRVDTTYQISMLGTLDVETQE